MQIPFFPAKCLKCGRPLPAHGVTCEACGYDPLEPAEGASGGEPLQTFAETWQGRPTSAWVTPSLIGINVLLFGVMVASGVSPLTPDGPSLSRWGANVGALTMEGQWWRLFTSMFLHIGIIHLLFNMVVLWGIGRVVERFVGSGGLAVVYLLAGLSGSLASIGWNPDVASAGASGAIFGLYGALLGFLLRDRQAIPRAIQQTSAKNALIFIAYNLVFGLMSRHVDVAAHLGGLAGGFICGFLIALPPTPEGGARRVRTNLLVLAGGALALGALAMAMPRERGVSGEFAQAKRIERQALTRFDDATAKVRAGTLDAAGFAAVIDGEVLPALREFRARLEVLAHNPRANVRSVEAMERYTLAREGVFSQVAHALRTGNQEEARTALDQQAAAASRFSEEMKLAQE